MPVLRCLPRTATLVLSALLLACTQETPPPAVSPQAALPPLPQGYLSTDQIPDSLAISPPPPVSGSIWARLDEEIANAALTLQGSARFEQAHVDAQFPFPASANHFACALGVAVDEAHTPSLYRLLGRTRADVSASTRAVKNHYQRPRPFMLNGQPTCSPEHEELLRGNGSYPSGHTAAGWVWALSLAEIAPERAAEIIQRGRSYGQSRVVCNVHWYSDVLQGQALAAAVMTKLHNNTEFLADLARARDEISSTRALALPLPHDCEAEAAALAIPIPGIR